MLALLLPLIIATVIVGVAVGRCCYPYASKHLMRINGLTITFMSTIKIKLNRFSEGPALPPPGCPFVPPRQMLEIDWGDAASEIQTNQNERAGGKGRCFGCVGILWNAGNVWRVSCRHANCQPACQASVTSKCHRPGHAPSASRPWSERNPLSAGWAQNMRDNLMSTLLQPGRQGNVLIKITHNGFWFY